MQEDISKVRHLAALPKPDVRLLMDAAPKVMYVLVPASPELAGSVVSWDAFRARFRLPAADTLASPFPFRHGVKGAEFPWCMPISADVTPPGTAGGDIVPGGSTASSSGLPARVHLPDSFSRADKLLANILNAARSGNLHLVEHQCNAVRDMLKVPELRISRGQTHRSTTDGADDPLPRLRPASCNSGVRPRDRPCKVAGGADMVPCHSCGSCWLLLVRLHPKPCMYEF